MKSEIQFVPKYLIKIVLPLDTFIVGTNNSKSFKEAKKIICHVRMMNFVWNENDFRIMNIPNECVVNYEVNFTESCNKLFDDNEVIPYLLSENCIDDYINYSSRYLDKYGNRI